MTSRMILLLEDDPLWRDRLFNKLAQPLQKRGYRLLPIADGDAEIAVKTATEGDVECAIVDEVLEVWAGEKKGAYQHLQGSDVVRKFEQLGIPCIVVSDVAGSIPLGDDSMDYAFKQHRRLSEPGNVKQFYHKRELASDESLYDRIVAKIVEITDGRHGKRGLESAIEFVVRVCVADPDTCNSLLQETRESPSSSAEEKEAAIWNMLSSLRKDKGGTSAAFQFGYRAESARFKSFKSSRRIPDRWFVVLLRLAVRQVAGGKNIVHASDYTQPKISPAPLPATHPGVRGPSGTNQPPRQPVLGQATEILFSGGASIRRPSRPLAATITRIRKDVRRSLGDHPKCANREWPFLPLPDGKYRFQESIRLEFVSKR